MTRLLAILGAILAALVCGLTGAYVLWQFHTNWGLVGGLFFVVLGIAIALPVPFHAGIAALRENVVLIVPVIVDALRGGNRRTDPPIEGRASLLPIGHPLDIPPPVLIAPTAPSDATPSIPPSDATKSPDAP